MGRGSLHFSDCAGLPTSAPQPGRHCEPPLAACYDAEYHYRGRGSLHFSDCAGLPTSELQAGRHCDTLKGTGHSAAVSWPIYRVIASQARDDELVGRLAPFKPSLAMTNKKGQIL